MGTDRNRLIKEYVSNLKVDISSVGFTKIWNGWRDIDYIPGYNKFYLIIDGEGWVKISDKEYFPKAGQMFLLPQGIKQSYSTINENTYTKYWCHFNAKLGDLNLFDVIKLPAYIDIDEMDVPTEYFRDLISSFNSTSITSGLRCKTAMLQIICYFLENSVVEDIRLIKNSSVERMRVVNEYIEAHISENVTVDKLAQLLHMHPNYFIRFFKKNVGTAPITYINRMRMETAKLLLKISDKPVYTISSEIGIIDSYYFSKLFKEYTGYAPTEYRRMMGEEEGKK